MKYISDLDIKEYDLAKKTTSKLVLQKSLSLYYISEVINSLRTNFEILNSMAYYTDYDCHYKVSSL